MKKSFLFLLISIMTVFLIAGCADDTTKGEETTQVTEGSESLEITVDGPTEINLTDPTTLQGAYEIVFFHTDGGKQLSVASDCTQVKKYTGTADAKCFQGTNNVEFQGYGTITVDDTNINIVTKMQMTNDNLKNGSGFWSIAKNSQYNYTVFTPIPKSSISSNTINASDSVKGVTGRDLTKNTQAKDTTYNFELTSNGYLKNNMLDKSSLSSFVGGANVTVIMKKISDTPIADMKKDKPLPTPVITGFVANPK